MVIASLLESFCDFNDIKTSGSELRGQEEAACTRISGLCDHYSDNRFGKICWAKRLQFQPH